MQLRDYQKECIEAIDQMEKGSALVVLATGLGKTVIFSHIKRRGRVLILSHREELVEQPKKYYQDCSYGIERGDKTSNGEDVLSASVQSLVRRLHKFDPKDFDMIITDEAHHAVAPSYRKIYDYFKPRIHIGFTATPVRGDSVGLGIVYDRILFERDLRWGIENGYLCDIECKIAEIGYDLTGVEEQMGDFKTSQLDDALDRDEINDCVLKAYVEMAKGQTVIFAVSIDHCEHLTERINKQCGEGTAVSITGLTENRNEILDKFRKKEIGCLVNCMVLTEGTDLPMIETIILARPTKNAALYAQMVGRAVRLYEGKEKAYLIDCVGISEDIDICMASTLLGKDFVEKKNGSGKLGEEEQQEETLLEKIERLPKRNFKVEHMMLEERTIDLFENYQKIDTYGVRFYGLFNGECCCNVGEDGMIYITKPDALGNCMIYLDKEDREPYVFRSNVPEKETKRVVENILMKHFLEQDYLWNKRKISYWGMMPASENQIRFIKSLTGSAWFREAYGEYRLDSELNKETAGITIKFLLKEKKNRK